MDGRILVFGDSITYGAWDIEGGWIQRLRKFLDEKNLINSNFCHIYNLGISGNTTEDLLERFEFETKQRLKESENEEIIFIFSIGINDSQFLHSQNSLRIRPEKFKENIQKLIKFAQKYASKTIFTGLTPVDDTRTNPIPWDMNKSYRNEHIQKYNTIIKSVCEEKKIYFIEVFDKIIKLNYQNLLEDGLHPNSEGHQRIFEIVKDFLIRNKIIN